MNGEIFVPAPCVMLPPGFTAWILGGQNQLATSHSSVEVRLWKIPLSNRRIFLNKTVAPEVYMQYRTANPAFFGNLC